MAISNIRSAHFGNVSNVTDLQITHGLTISANDVLLAFLQTNDATYTISDNNGATPWTRRVTQGSPESSVHELWYRVAGASEPATFHWTISTGTAYGIIVMAIAGVDTSTIWDVDPSGTTQTGTVAASPNRFITLNSITVTNAGSLGICAVGADSSTSPYFSLKTANGYGNETETTIARRLATYYRENLSAGAVGAVEINCADSADGWVGWHFSLKPAAGAGTTLLDEWGMMGFYGV